MKTLLNELRDEVVTLRNEISCRIEHGAESGGHLEYVLQQIDEILGKKRNDEKTGNAVLAGDVCVIDDPEAQGSTDEVTKIPLSLVIEFKKPEDIRLAMTTGECRFTIFERNKDGRAA